MVAGRSHQRERILRLALKHAVYADEHRARRQPRHFKRPLADYRVEVNVRYAALAELANLLDQSFAVTACDLCVGGFARRELVELRPERRVARERFKDHVEASGIFWMMAGLMLARGRVIDQCGGHARIIEEEVGS